MVLELARRLGARRDPPPRRVVFIAFSGEEQGLLGLAVLCGAPAVPPVVDRHDDQLRHGRPAQRPE